jgi:hypothetical protein
MYCSYRSCLFNIMDAIFEACSLWAPHALVDSKMGESFNFQALCTIRGDSYNIGHNALQIIEQCEKAVSKLTGYAVVNDNYLHKCEKGDFQDFSRKQMAFLEVFIAHEPYR